MAQPVRIGVPSGPMINTDTGEVTQAWLGFFVALWQRTGSSAGGVQASASDLAAETAAREAADQALTASLSSETSARASGDAANHALIAAEGATRSAADAHLGLTTVSSMLHTSGTGLPSYSAPVGSLYSRTDGTVGATLYVSQAGGAWLAIAGV